MTLGPVGVSCCTSPGVGGSGGPIGGGPESCRRVLPTLDNCYNICTGQSSYYQSDSCGTAWGDWCGYLYSEVWPSGDIVCEVSSRIYLKEDISLELEVPPPPTGRYKYDGQGGCYWDPNDSGPDQCQPATGRWKLDGNGGCYWDPNDSGPDQCLLAAQGGLRGNGPTGTAYVIILLSALLAGRVVSRSRSGPRAESVAG